MILSCHQPNFLPWNPFFEKVSQSDIFIILGNVQYTRHQYQNRFQHNDNWYTMAVNSGNLYDLIIDKSYVNYLLDWQRIKNRLIHVNLSFFDKFISSSLFETNTNLIIEIMRMKNIRTNYFIETKRSIDNPTEMIIDLCKKHSAGTYLAGPSGKKYLDTSLFVKNGISLEYFSAKENTTFIEYLENHENR
ncbi:WbqC-like protein family [actinobacterium SCGC AAA044-D11]